MSSPKKPRHINRVQRGLALLKQALQAAQNMVDPKVRIEIDTYEDNGFRIGEIRSVKEVPAGMTSAATMRVDEDSCGWILRAEDVVLSYGTDEFDGNLAYFVRAYLGLQI